ALRDAVEQGRLARPLVFTNGVFDILHRGHVSYLDEAAQLGASLIVGVNTDASVRRLNKGPERPINPEQDRAALLAALACVDAVVLFDEDTPEALIAALRPDLIVKGGDYDMEALPETALVRSWGGDAVAIPFEFQRSTTALVKKLRD
ncbi:TPA: D-glycero-beta-D-manno-heptose 1-phosphate adenylyltransferase, partial [Klebsiella pneumoniae]|nr:D-glycero-beta-D-manno-heptose 1-phosphate adenylyltransferase [Klebsiella pneumoniae]